MGTSGLNFIEALKRIATPENRIAIEELERRGFRLLVHNYGIENAAEKLRGLDDAMKSGQLTDYVERELYRQ